MTCSVCGKDLKNTHKYILIAELKYIGCAQRCLQVLTNLDSQLGVCVSREDAKLKLFEQSHLLSPH